MHEIFMVSLVSAARGQARPAPMRLLSSSLPYRVLHQVSFCGADGGDD